MRKLVAALAAILIVSTVGMDARSNGMTQSPQNTEFHFLRADLTLADLTQTAEYVVEGQVLSASSGAYASRSDLKNPLSAEEQTLVDGGLEYEEWALTVSSWLKGSGGSQIILRRATSSSGAFSSQLPVLTVGRQYRIWASAGAAFTTAPYFVPSEAVGLPLTSLSSVASDGGPANGMSSGVSLSADGRYIAFHSQASNLVQGDTNGQADVFVRDVESGITTRVSVDAFGNQATGGGSNDPSISGDGRFIAFWSTATNLVPGDTNGAGDIFVRDTAQGSTIRISIDSAGVQANAGSLAPAISATGMNVVFSSAASNLVASDTNSRYDIFVRDLVSNTTVRASVDSSGAQANGDSRAPGISADGRITAFESDATNLVPVDTNVATDIYVRDLTSLTTTLASVDDSGVQANGNSYEPVVSGGGQVIAFSSYGSNLVPLDTNGGRDVFARDLQNSQTVRVSVDSNEVQGIGDSLQPAISFSGRYVAYCSYAANFVAGDTNFVADIFIRDVKGMTTVRVSVDQAGAQANAGSFDPAVSGDGRYVAYRSDASNLVPGDTNGQPDIIRRVTY